MIKKRMHTVYINECEICTTFAQHIDLEDDPMPQAYSRLKQIFRQDTSEERYESDWHTILKCPVCGTFYHQNNYEDREDAMACGPWIKHTFERYSFTRLQSALKKLGLFKEAALFTERYEQTIEHYLELVKNHPGDIQPNIRTHLLESITDYFLKKDDWQGLKNFLQNKDASITLSAGKNVILLYGCNPYRGIFPGPGKNHDVTEESHTKTRSLLTDYRKEFLQILLDVIPVYPVNFKPDLFSILEEAYYYQIKTSDILPRMISFLTASNIDDSLKTKIFDFLLAEDVDAARNWPAIEDLLSSETETERLTGVLFVKDYLKKTPEKAREILDRITNIKLSGNISNNDQIEIQKIISKCNSILAGQSDPVFVSKKMIRDFDRALSTKNGERIRELLIRGISQKDVFTLWPFATFLVLGLPDKKECALILEMMYKKDSSNIDFVPINEKSALSTAAGMGLKEAVDILLECGANPNTRDYYKGTPLISAVQGGDVDIIQSLLEHGADPELANDQKRTPLMEACDRGFVEAARLLLEYTSRAKLKKKDWLGNTVFDLCSKSNYTSSSQSNSAAKKAESKNKAKIRRLLEAKK